MKCQGCLFELEGAHLADSNNFEICEEFNVFSLNDLIDHLSVKILSKKARSWRNRPRKGAFK